MGRLITKDKEMSEALAEISRQYQQPAMACALVNSKEIITRAAAGCPVYGQNERVSPDSRFHIGSTTKSMTALLIQILVDEGKLSYQTTLEQALPDLSLRVEYRDATLQPLLLNQAGILPFQRLDLEKPETVSKLWSEIPAACSTSPQQRREVAQFVLNQPPAAEPGTRAIYSNVGWSIAGLIAETTAQKPYEELLQERIFEPLGMKNARIGGWPASPAEPNQPRGHYPAAASPRPQELKDGYTFPDWMNPSGGVHCSIGDYALFVRENLAGLKGRGKLLSMQSYQNIHSIHLTAKIKDLYQGIEQDADLTLGYGWAVVPLEGGFLSAANGSGGTFYATIAIYPAMDAGFAGFTNCGDGSAALNEAIKRITGLDIRL